MPRWNPTHKRLIGRNTIERKKRRWSKKRIEETPDCDASLTSLKRERPGRMVGKEEPQTAMQI